MVPAAAVDDAGAMTTTPPEPGEDTLRSDAGTEPPAAGHPSASAPTMTPDHGPRVSRDQLRDLDRLRRSVTDRKLGGVSAGIARHLDIDPVIIRVAFVVLVFFGGSGLLLYGGLWALLPEEGPDRRAAIHLDPGARTVALVGLGMISTLLLLGDALTGTWFPGAWPLAVVALIVAVLFMRRHDDAAHQPTRPDPTTGQAPGEALQPGAAAPYAASWEAGPIDPTLRQSVSQHDPGQPLDQAGPPPPSYDAGWPPASGPTPAPARRPRNPRKRGPILFWVTGALVMLALGLLGVADVGGAAVPAAAYPALALTLIGGMLVLGAFFGRAGGLILMGLAAAVVLAGTTTAERWEGETERYVPASASEVRDRYDINGGELVVDLSQVADPEELDGRSLEVESGAGRVEVFLPVGLDSEVDARAGVGSVTVGEQTRDGFGIEVSDSTSGWLDAGLELDVQVGAGEIEVSYR